MSQRNKQPPTDWNTYEHGRASSFGSLESVPEDDQPSRFFSTSTPRDIPQRDGYDEGTRLRRKSSLGKRFDSLRQMGGPNSIDNFAKSLQRAAGFREITPVRRNSVHLPDGDEEDGPDVAEQSTAPNRSLLRQQLLHYDMRPDSGSAVQDEQSEADAPTEASRLLPSQSRQTLRSQIGSQDHGARHSSLYATSYGSISSKLTVTARQRASILIMEQEEASRRAREGLDHKFEEEPPRIVEQEIRPDGEVIQRIVGESTVPMTVFNSTNVLIGVGILALPLGIKYAGWVMGLSFLTLSALATSYTAKLLAKCLDTNTGSSTYGDIAFLAFGTMGRNLVESLFILELTGANVALVILFSDSMSSLITVFDNTTWKIIISVGLIPLNFVPFKYLSFTSVIGIFCCLSIVLIIFADGLIKPHAPGSLREIAKTYAFPENWATVPLSLGLIMAPWGGHSVFPAVYKDMRHPQKYVKAVRYTYIFTYGLDSSMAVLGYLMFGEKVMDEVTANILRSTAYPHALSIVIVILIAVIPVTKIPLSNRPMQDTINKKFYIDLRQMDAKARMHSEKSWKHRIARSSVGILANLVQLGFAIFFPDFDSLMALLGSLFCFTVCIILPVSFYLKIFSSEGKEISPRERMGCYALFAVSSVLAIIGTTFAIIPKDKFGIK